MAEHTTANGTRTAAPDDAPLVGGAVALAASLLVSAVGALVLPAQVTVHYTLGLGPYYGPETLSRSVVLVLFPALVAGLALLTRLLAVELADHPDAAARRVAEVVLLASLGLVVLVQAVVFALAV